MKIGMKEIYVWKLEYKDRIECRKVKEDHWELTFIATEYTGREVSRVINLSSQECVFTHTIFDGGREVWNRIK